MRFDLTSGQVLFKCRLCFDRDGQMGFADRPHVLWKTICKPLMATLTACQTTQRYLVNSGVRFLSQLQTDIE